MTAPNRPSEPNRSPGPLARALGRFGVRGGRGQSVVEFALILPIALTLVGAAIDFSRLYNQWVNQEAATRDAAEYVATCVNGSTIRIRCDGVGASTTAVQAAQKVVCTELGKSASCTDPTVTVPLYTQDPSAAVGGTSTAPRTTVTVQTSTIFRTLFPYPLLTNNGQRTMTIARTFAILQGR